MTVDIDTDSITGSKTVTPNSNTTTERLAPPPDVQCILRDQLLQRWGVLSTVARRLRKSQEYVRLVYYGQRHSRAVERALRRRGLHTFGSITQERHV